MSVLTSRDPVLSEQSFLGLKRPEIVKNIEEKTIHTIIHLQFQEKEREGSKNTGLHYHNNHSSAPCLSPHAGGETSTLGVVRHLSPVVMFVTCSSVGSRNHIFSFFVFSYRDIKPDNILLDEHGKPVMNAF